METKKLFLTTGILFFSISGYGQVGINNTNPRATLDITSSPGSTAKPDGVIPPRLKGSEVKAKDGAYGADQTGALIYVTEGLASGTTSPKTHNIVESGYYYFNGTEWLRFNDEGVAPLAPLTKVAFNGSGSYNTAVIPAGTIKKLSFPNINISVDPGIGTWNTTTSEMTVTRKGVFTVTTSLIYENIATTTNANLTIKAGSESESTMVLFATQGAVSIFQRNNITSIFVLSPGDKIWVEADRPNEAWAVGKRTLNITFSEVN